MQFLRVTVGVCAAAMMVTAACASDINFGSSARSIAMGGAGLALTDDPSTASVINPAAAVASGSRFRFIMPDIDLHTRGASITDLRSSLNELSSGSTDDAITLAERFGKGQTTLSAGAIMGFTGGLGVTAEGEAQGTINPSANFSEWVNAGLPRTAADLAASVLSGDISNAAFTTAINAALADGTISGADSANIAAAFTAGTNVQAKLLYSVPSVSWGTGFNTSNGGKLWFGTKMRWMNSEVHTWTVNQDPSVTDSVRLQATETAKVTDSGFGADVGFVYQPKNSIAQFGMVINNFWNPALSGVETPRMYSVGMASQPRANFRYAIDLVNLNKAYHENTKLRMGAEWTLGSMLALRAGNSGDGGWTYGVGVGGFNFAFSKDAPSMISRVLRF